MNTSADELDQHIKLLQKFVDLADQASSEKGDNGHGGMIMNSASLEDVPLSEASDNRAQSVLSLHTEEDVDSSPSTPLAKSLSCDGEPSKEELLESLKNSENKMEHLAAEHGYLVGMTDEFKSGLNTIELQLRNKKDNGIGEPMPTTATHTFLQHFLKRLELQEKIEEKLDKRRPLLPKELSTLSDKNNVCESVPKIAANEANRNEYPTNEKSEKNSTPRNYSPSASNTRTSTPLPSRPTRYDLAKCLAQVSAGLSEQALDLQEERTRIKELQTKVAKQQSEVADAIKLSASTLMRNSLTPTPTPTPSITPTPIIAPVTVAAESVLASPRPIPAPRTLKTLDPVKAKNSESDKKSQDEMRKIVTNCKENTDKLNSIMTRLNDLSEIAKDSTKTEENECPALNNAVVNDVPTYQAHRPSEPRYCCQGVTRESADIMQNILTSLVESTEIILQQQQKVEEHLNTIKMLNEKLNQKASKDDVTGGSTLYPHTYRLSQPQPQQHKISGPQRINGMAPQTPLDCYNGMPLQPHFSYYMLGPQPQYAYKYPMAPQPQFAYTNHMAPQPQYAFNSGMTSPPALYNPYQPNVEQPLPQYIHLPEQYQRPQQNVMLGHQSQIHYPSIGEYHYSKNDDENDKN